MVTICNPTVNHGSPMILPAQWLPFAHHGDLRLRFLVAFLFFLAFVITAVMLDRKGAITVVSWWLGASGRASGRWYLIQPPLLNVWVVSSVNSG